MAAAGLRVTLVSRLTFHGSWEQAEHDADGRGSFAAVEGSMSDSEIEPSVHR